MYLLIRYPAGVIVEALVLGKGKNRMRAAVAGFSDTIELRRSGSQWFTETSEPIEFDFLMSNAYASENVWPVRAARAIGAAAIQQ
jgi:hypothetical protein